MPEKMNMCIERKNKWALVVVSIVFIAISGETQRLFTTCIIAFHLIWKL